jgi:RNA polymerase sigma factor (sigma-70 family)
MYRHERGSAIRRARFLICHTSAAEQPDTCRRAPAACSDRGRFDRIPARFPWKYLMPDDPRFSEVNPPVGNRGDRESTGALIDRARHGDQQALERLFARHLRLLPRWASGRLPRWARDFADTDDLVHDVLLQTFTRIGESDPRGVGALRAYLRRAVVNRLRDELRRKGRRPDSTDLDDLELAKMGSRARGRGALKRDLIIARVEMDYTYEEPALAFGKPTPDAACKAAQRALVRLAEEMTRG